MTRITKPKRRVTAAVVLAVLLCVVLLPMMATYTFFSQYILGVARKNVGDTNRQMLEYFVSEIETDLTNISYYLLSLCGTEASVRTLANPFAGRERILAKYRLRNKLSQDILLYGSVSCFYFYTSDTGMELIVTRGNRSVERTGSAVTFMRSYLGGGNSVNRAWQLLENNGERFLLRVFLINDSALCAYVSVDEMPLRQKLGFFTEEPLQFRKHGEEARPRPGSIQFLQPSSIGDFDIVVEVDEEEVLQYLPRLRRLLLSQSALLTAMIPLWILLFRHFFLRPLQELVSVMRRVQRGEMDVRMTASHRVEELAIAGGTFNQMLDHIHTLRIGIYEEQLEKQRIQAQCVSLQINPHFFINSLNTVYLLSRKQDNEAVQRMLRLLIHYFASVLQSDAPEISYGEEMERVRNYVEVQRIRYGDTIELREELSESLFNEFVPSLIVLTFVENAIKYAKLDDRGLTIIVSAKAETSEEGANRLHITIRDNGHGFHRDVLAKLCKGEAVWREDRLHIGIQNVMARVRSLYGVRAAICFGNAEDGGARVDIWLPLSIGGTNGARRGLREFADR